MRLGAQTRKLREWGIEPFVSVTGRISVTWDVVDEVLRRRSGLEARELAKRRRPNLHAVT